MEFIDPDGCCGRYLERRRRDQGRQLGIEALFGILIDDRKRAG
jgi:hypothetical protein